MKSLYKKLDNFRTVIYILTITSICNIKLTIEGRPITGLSLQTIQLLLAFLLYQNYKKKKDTEEIVKLERQ